MPTINELTTEMEAAFNEMLMLADDDADDIQRNEVLTAIYDSAQGTIEKKLEYMLFLLAEAKDLATIRKAVADRATKRAKTAKNEVERLKSFIYLAMSKAKIKKIDNHHNAATMQKGRIVAFIPESVELKYLSDRFTRYTPESWVPDKVAIKKALKDGEFIHDEIELVKGADYVVIR